MSEQKEIQVMELVAARDVKKGEEVSLDELFTIEERKKEFQVKSDIRWGSRLKLNISKLGRLEAVCDAIGGRIGNKEKASLWQLLSIKDQRRRLVAEDTIRKGEKMKISVEGSLYW